VRRQPERPVAVIQFDDSRASSTASNASVKKLGGG
jgi:hypothetical protein